VRRALKAGLVVVLFAGAGGSCTGIKAALKREVDVAVNHSAVALAVHKANNPRTEHLVADVWEVDPKIATRGRKVDLLWASPDCRHFSRAKSGTPRSIGVRSLAHVVIEWARAVRPSVIMLENVAEFLDWGPLDENGERIKERAGESFGYWKGALQLLGYNVEHRVLDASHYGAPTKRKRLFIVARCDGQPIRWPAPTHGPGLAPFRTAAECIDWSLPCPSIFGRKRPLAEKTLARVAEGIRRYVIEAPEPYLVRYNGQGAALSVDDPLGTITTRDRFGLVAPTLVQTGYGERPGQTPRALDLHAPMGTLVAGAVKQGLVAAFLTRHYGGVYGQPLEVPMSTITAQDHHALTAVALAKFRGTAPNQPMSTDPRAPLPTISAGGIHVAAVQALLSKHGVQPPSFRIGGELYGIGDIGMRMLEPHELLRAQFGRFAEGYDLSAATTKSAQVRLVGNSVCPEAAEALVLANFEEAGERAA
jgi:DNA (cytosine-5)-methyltransferase 1